MEVFLVLVHGRGVPLQHKNTRIVTYDQLMASLKKKDYRPVYVLHGEEAYFIDVLAQYVEQHVLDEGERAFNQTVLYGKDTQSATLVDCARRYPMMAPYQVVLLKEAQEMRSLADLQGYIEKPTPTTILVICHKYKKLAMNTKLGKAVAAHSVVFESKKLYDNQVADWIMGYVSQIGLGIGPQAAGLVAEYLGADLAKIANEMDKLALNLPAGSDITDKHIEEHIGISRDYNVFELQKAVSQRDVLKANRIVNHFASNLNKNPNVLTIGSLFNFFSKLYVYHFVANQPEADILKAMGLRSAYFLRDYKAAARQFPPSHTHKVIGVLREYDLKSKGVGFVGDDGGALLREMVWKLLH